MHGHYALHPIEAVVQYHRERAEISGEERHCGLDFEQAEAHCRAGAQRLRLSEIPQLPQQLRELSSLKEVDGNRFPFPPSPFYTSLRSLSYGGHGSTGLNF